MEEVKNEEVVEETIEHEVSEEEIKENGLEDVLEPGDKIEIPVEEEKDKPKEENYRECTCGRLVALPDGSGEDFTMCDCGIRHTR